MDSGAELGGGIFLLNSRVKKTLNNAECLSTAKVGRQKGYRYSMICSRSIHNEEMNKMKPILHPYSRARGGQYPSNFTK